MAAAEEIDTDVEPFSDNRAALETMSMSQMKDICREKKITKFSSRTKGDLIDHMLEQDTIKNSRISPIHSKRKSNASNASVVGTAYERKLLTEIQRSFDEKFTDHNPFKKSNETNVVLKVEKAAAAGNGAGSDLEGSITISVDAFGTMSKPLKIEVKHIKKDNDDVYHVEETPPSSGGLDFGQFSLLYFLDVNTNSGCWIANTTGGIWEKAGGKFQPMIVNTVNKFNSIARDEPETFINMTPSDYLQEQSMWSALSSKVANNHVNNKRNLEIIGTFMNRSYSSQELKQKINSRSIVLIKGIHEEVYHVPNKRGTPNPIIVVTKENKEGKMVTTRKYKNPTFDEQKTTPAAVYKRDFKGNPVPHLIQKHTDCMGVGSEFNFTAKDNYSQANDDAEYIQQLIEFYKTKGDDMIHIRHYGLFALNGLDYYSGDGGTPPCPEHWYQNDNFFFQNILTHPNTGIGIRFRLKGHGNTASGVRNYTCAVRFDLNREKSPYSLDIDTDVDELTTHWDRTLRDIPRNAKQETFEELNRRKMCVAMGTKKCKKKKSKKCKTKKGKKCKNKSKKCKPKKGKKCKTKKDKH